MVKGSKIEKKTADTFTIKYPEVDKSVLVWIHKNMKTHEECNVDDHFFGDLSVCISRSTACESVCESVIMAEYDPRGTSRQEHLNMFLSTLAGVRVFVFMYGSGQICDRIRKIYQACEFKMKTKFSPRVPSTHLIT